MTDTTYRIKYESPDLSELRTAAVRFNPDDAIKTLYRLREEYPTITFILEPEIGAPSD